MTSDFVSQHDAASLIGVSVPELRRLCKSRQITHRPFSPRLSIFRRSDVESYIQERDAMRSRMLNAARGTASLLTTGNAVPIEGRAGRVIESDVLSPDILDEAAVQLVTSRFQCRHSMRGWTYAIRCDASGLTKIGMTESTKPWLRIASLIMMNGAPLRLLGLAHGADFERVLHVIHMHVRQHGEWFALTENPLPNRRECASCRYVRKPAGAWDPYAI